MFCACMYEMVRNRKAPVVVTVTIVLFIVNTGHLEFYVGFDSMAFACAYTFLHVNIAFL